MKTGERAHVALVFVQKSDHPEDVMSYSLGAGYVGAYLNRQGFRAVQIVTDDVVDVRTFVRRVLDYQPRIVGFTVHEVNYMPCLLLAKAVKSASPGCITVFGGPLATAVPDTIMTHHPWVDICVRGEGEETLEAILRLVLENPEPGGIPDPGRWMHIRGIHLRAPEGIRKTPDTTIITATKPSDHYVDRYPSPYLSGWIPTSAAHDIGIITARGCNQSCIYCNCAVMWKRKIFPHSIDRVLEELDCISRDPHVLEPVPIFDDAFNLLPKRAEKICLGLLENKIRLPLTCMARCDLISEDLIRLLLEAGFVSLLFSLESAVPRVLRAIGKVSPPDTPSDPDFRREQNYLDKLEHHMAFARKIGFSNLNLSYMVGLPGETADDIAKTVAFAARLKADRCNHNVFKIYPGTPIFQEAQKHGYHLAYVRPSTPVPTVVFRKHSEDGLNAPPFSNQRTRTSEVVRRAAGVFSLVTRKKFPQTCFSRIILVSDRIPEGFLNWANENLSLGGACLHLVDLPSRVEFATDIYGKMHDALAMCVTGYQPYCLMPGSQHAPERYCPEFAVHSQSRRTDGFFYRTGVASFLSGGIPITVNGQWPVAIEASEVDVVALQNLFEQIETSPDPFFDLWHLPSLPWFLQLCKWRVRDANCRSFETAIVDNFGNVRLCWHADPSGTLDDSHQTLVTAFQKAAAEKTATRECRDCTVRETCIQCVYPYPLGERSYCEYRRRRGPYPAAEIIAAFQKP